MKDHAGKIPLVTICGRTNVGKSTMFNRLIEKRQALVSDIEGTTRDCNIGLVHWDKKIFSMADTASQINAGFISGQKKIKEDIDSLAQKQALEYVKQAQLLLFIVDGKAGPLSEDLELAKAIRRQPQYLKKTILVVNKIDSGKLRGEAATFNTLGLGEPLAISAQTGAGTGDLLDIVLTRIQAALDINEEEEKEIAARLCIVGKPNVGKSSLLNSLLGYERVIVSDQPHTTRESQDTEIEHDGKIIPMIDTAAIYRHGHKCKG